MTAILFLYCGSRGWKNLDQTVKQGGSDQIGTTILFIVHFSHKMLFVLKCLVYNIVCYLYSFLVQNGQNDFKLIFPTLYWRFIAVGIYLSQQIQCWSLFSAVCSSTSYILYTISKIENASIVKCFSLSILFYTSFIRFLFLHNTCCPVHSSTFNVLRVADPCWN